MFRQVSAPFSYQGRHTGSLLSPTGLPAWDPPEKDVMPWTGDAAAGAELPCIGLEFTATGTPVLAYRGMTGAEAEVKAGLGIRKANCPSVAGTSWNPPKTLGDTASTGLSLEPMGAPLMGREDGSCTWRGWARCACWEGACCG